MRPQRYEITGVRTKDRTTYEVSATLTFLAGPETRVYEVSLHDTDQSITTTKASEDISGTEEHARSILQSWLDSWIAGGDMMTFKKKHPEVSATMARDGNWASLSSEGKRLIRYEIINAAKTSTGFNYTISAMIEARGIPETKILYYYLGKDRNYMVGDGRWDISSK